YFYTLSLHDALPIYIKVTYGALSRTLHIVYQTDSGKTLDEVPLKGKTGEKYTIDLRANKYPGYEIAKQPDSLTNRFDPNVTRIIDRKSTRLNSSHVS